MKVPLAVALLIVVAVGAVAGIYVYNFRKSDSASMSTCTDPASISSHVYHPYRLQIVKPCVTASGTVDRVIGEQDGDLHIRLNLDYTYSNLTNTANDGYPNNGDLVVEIICVNPPTQTDEIPSCENYTNRIPVPSEGQHITVTGPYVFDNDHNGWAEIHPVYSLVIDASQAVVSVTRASLEISYPDGSGYGWLGPTPRSYSGWHAVNVSPGDQFTSTISLYSTSSSEEQIISITISTSGFSVTSVSPGPPITFDPYARQA